MTNNRINSKQGFSLVELMVSVVIVGLLAALALSQFNVYQKKIWMSKVQSVYNQAAALGQDMLIGDMPAGVDSNDYMVCSYNARMLSGGVSLSTGGSGPSGSTISFCFGGTSKIHPIIRGLRPAGANLRVYLNITFGMNQVDHVDVYIYDSSTAQIMRCNDWTTGKKMACTSSF